MSLSDLPILKGGYLIKGVLSAMRLLCALFGQQSLFAIAYKTARPIFCSAVSLYRLAWVAC